MNINLDDFINSIISHPNAKEDEEQKESAEILLKDSEIEKVVKVYDRFSDIKLKKLYGKWILGLLCAWVLFVIVFSFFQLYVCKRVSDEVFITLITTSTANIIGLPWIILNNLFPKKS